MSLLTQALGRKKRKKIPNRAQRRALMGQPPSHMLMLRIIKAKFAKWNRDLKAAILDAYRLTRTDGGDWDESAHPRDNQGRFGDGGGLRSGEARPSFGHGVVSLSFIKKDDVLRVMGATRYNTENVEKTVDIADLHATQPAVEQPKVERFKKEGFDKEKGKPFVVKYDNKLLVMDGHHRIQAESENGAKQISVLFFDADSARTDADPADYIHKRIESFRVRVAKVFSEEQLAPELHVFADRVSRRGKEALVRVVGIAFRDVGLGDKVDEFVERNIDLIQSVANDQLDDMLEMITEATDEGLRVEELADLIGERFDVSESRAELIARDQTLKLNGEIAQTRMESLGVEEYVWSTSGDERVREGHDELDGTTQRFDDPPVTNEKTGEKNNPSEDFQCRCVAFPILPELQEQESGTEEETPEE